MFSVLTCAALMLLAVRLRMRLQLRGQQLVRRENRGLLRVELRRCAEMRTHADGLGGQSFPEPIETRSLAVLLCELPLWIRSESVGLPCGTEAHLDQLVTTDYDRHFTFDFRAAPAARPASRLHLPA